MSYKEEFERAVYDPHEAAYENGYRDGRNDAPYYDFGELDNVIKYRSSDRSYRAGYRAGWVS